MTKWGRSQAQSKWRLGSTSAVNRFMLQKWVDLSNGITGLALLNSTKYGHSYHNGELRITLLRSAGAPDIYPNLGKFNISYALYPHAGDWNFNDVLF